MAVLSHRVRRRQEHGQPATLPLSGDSWGVKALLARSRSENFVVASKLLPPRTRRHLLALYGYFRLVDYAGDEAPGQRDALLDLLEVDLKRVYRGSPRIPQLRALETTVRECGIPCEVLIRLIDANRQDQRVRRYRTFQELLDYCSLSADPVGESVLRVFGSAVPELIELSNKVCTSLQILEHCQDVAEDFRQDRVYLPTEDLERFGCREDELTGRFASLRWRKLLRFEVDRAGQLLEEGTPLVDRLSGHARFAVAGYVAGGRATVRAFDTARFDPLSTTVRRSPTWTVVEWSRLLVGGGP